MVDPIKIKLETVKHILTLPFNGVEERFISKSKPKLLSGKYFLE